MTTIFFSLQPLFNFLYIKTFKSILQVAERSFHDVDNGAKMKNFYILLFLMSSNFPFSSNSANNKHPVIIEPRPSFHQIVVKIKLPIENEESTEINLALCENHPWSLNQCQTQKLQGNKRTFALNNKSM